MKLQTIANRYFDFLDRRGTTFNVVVGLFCTALLGFVDYYSDTITGVDYTLAFFYMLPVSFVAWFAGREAGIAISLVCILTKMSVQFTSEETLSLIIWKDGTSLGFFIVTTILITKIRELLEHEKLLSRTDHLTGAANTKAFLEALTSEVFREQRHFLQRGHYHPFGLAYIDLDDFKKINDDFGHTAGDVVLKTVAATIARNLRRTDVIARLGGDEFAILLPDTDAEAGPAAMEKIREQLHISMAQLLMPVTFSIGLLTCPEPPEIADEVLTFADNLMYEVKKSGKNSVRHAVYAKQGRVPADFLSV